MASSSDHKRILRAIALLAVALVAAAHFQFARADDAGHGSEVPATQFERFLLAGCTRCVGESHWVTTLPTVAAKISGIPRSGAAQPGRAGEIRVEVLRARQLGKPGRQMLALRITLSVSVAAGGELYRMAAGLVDEDEVSALSATVSDIAGLAAAGPSGAGAELIDANARNGSLRIGWLTLRGGSVAYIQAGDPAALALRAVWDVPATLYLPAEQLPALADAIGQAAAKIRHLRGL